MQRVSDIENREWRRWGIREHSICISTLRLHVRICAHIMIFHLFSNWFFFSWKSRLSPRENHTCCSTHERERNKRGGFFRRVPSSLSWLASKLHILSTYTQRNEAFSYGVYHGSSWRIRSSSSSSTSSGLANEAALALLALLSIAVAHLRACCARGRILFDAYIVFVASTVLSLSVGGP